MDREATLLASLASGPLTWSEMPLAKSTRYDIARRLEQSGLLRRGQGRWHLTKAGWQHAMERHGIQPQATIYMEANQFVNAFELSPVNPHVDKVEQFAWALVVATLLAGAAWLIGYLDLQASVASWLLSIF